MWAWRGLVKAVLCPRLSTPSPSGREPARRIGSAGGVIIRGCMRPAPPHAPGRDAGERGAPLLSRVGLMQVIVRPGTKPASRALKGPTARGDPTPLHPIPRGFPLHWWSGWVLPSTRLGWAGASPVLIPHPPSLHAHPAPSPSSTCILHPHPTTSPSSPHNLSILTPRPPVCPQVSRALTARSTSTSATLTRATTGPARTALPPSPASASLATRATAATSTSTSARASPAKTGGPARTGTTPTTACASRGPQVSKGSGRGSRASEVPGPTPGQVRRDARGGPGPPPAATPILGTAWGRGVLGQDEFSRFSALAPAGSLEAACGGGSLLWSGEQHGGACPRVLFCLVSRAGAPQAPNAPAFLLKGPTARSTWTTAPATPATMASASTRSTATSAPASRATQVREGTAVAACSLAQVGTLWVTRGWGEEGRRCCPPVGDFCGREQPG